DGAGLADLELRRGGVGVAAQVDVVDHLLAQVGGVRDEGEVRVDVRRHPQRGEHLQAEAVGGGDGRGVELRQRPGQATPAHLHLGVVDVGEVGDDDVPARPGGPRVTQGALGVDQPLADAVAQLGGGGPAEGDEHEVAELHALLGDVPGGEGGDGEGLAGAGACLQDGGAAGQRAADVEDGQLGGGVSTVSVRESHRL